MPNKGKITKALPIEELFLSKAKVVIQKDKTSIDAPISKSNKVLDETTSSLTPPVSVIYPSFFAKALNVSNQLPNKTSNNISAARSTSNVPVLIPIKTLNIISAAKNTSNEKSLPELIPIKTLMPLTTLKSIKLNVSSVKPQKTSFQASANNNWQSPGKPEMQKKSTMIFFDLPLPPSHFQGNTINQSSNKHW